VEIFKLSLKTQFDAFMDSNFGFEIQSWFRSWLKGLMVLFVTRGVTALPLNRNLVMRFRKEGGSKEERSGGEEYLR
jgi:hypothetical protein